MTVEELIQKLREMGFKLTEVEEDYLWLLRMESVDYTAQIFVIKNE